MSKLKTTSSTKPEKSTLIHLCLTQDKDRVWWSTDLRPVWDPNAAYFISDTRIRQGLHPPTNKPFLPVIEKTSISNTVEEMRFRTNECKLSNRIVLTYVNHVYLSGVNERYLSPGCLKLFSFWMIHCKKFQQHKS